ncbi:MAG: Ig-like domain-containing protein, partial [Ilumatobacteraceae bacterium]
MVTSSGTPTLNPNPANGITLTAAVTGNRGTITFGGTGLSSNTTYTLTVPLTTFTDTSGNNIENTGDASLTFTFATNPVPTGGGGGGTPGSCGPPPLPPCGVGPGLNFGPGGMIQN